MSGVFKMQMAAASRWFFPVSRPVAYRAADRGCGPRRTLLLRTRPPASSLFPRFAVFQRRKKEREMELFSEHLIKKAHKRLQRERECRGSL